MHAVHACMLRGRLAARDWHVSSAGLMNIIGHPVVAFWRFGGWCEIPQAPCIARSKVERASRAGGAHRARQQFWR